MGKKNLILLILFISNVLIFITNLIFVIRNSLFFNKEILFWTFTKISTIKSILSNNANKYFPILNIAKDFEIINLNKSYEYLLNYSTNDICQKGFKKCGILDTYGNIMCLENDIPCPINEIIIDYKDKEIEYINSGFHSLELNENENIYFTNKSIDKEIIIELKYSKEHPKLITKENIIINEIIYYNFFKLNINISKNNIDSMICKDFFYNQINNKDNIDITFKNIYENYYIKKYIGFENYKQMDNFIKFDYYIRYNSYKIVKSYNMLFYSISVFLYIFFIILFILAKISNKANKLSLYIPLIAIFISNIIYLIIHLIKYFILDDIDEFLKKYEYLMDNLIKELSIFIINKTFLIIYFHLNSFNNFILLLFILFCIKLENKKRRPVKLGVPIQPNFNYGINFVFYNY